MKRPAFAVITGKVVDELLSRSYHDVVAVVRETYLTHHQKGTNNPDSYFLRFQDKPEARIIALPAAITGRISGLKWISSYPYNIRSNLQRASATLILNDYETGYPLACIEASQISSARTAASAVLAAKELNSGSTLANKIAFIGAGVIAKETLEFFHALTWTIGEIVVHDVEAAYSTQFAEHAARLTGRPCLVSQSLRDAVQDASHVVFATTASEPYVSDFGLFNAGQVVLNLSLRDLCPDVIVRCNNVFDDVEHCMKANTSPHLAEQRQGNRDFVNGTLADAMTGRLKLDRSKPTVFSPFGLGVLDVALGHFLFDRAQKSGLALQVDDFFHNVLRW